MLDCRGRCAAQSIGGQLAKLLDHRRADRELGNRLCVWLQALWASGTKRKMASKIQPGDILVTYVSSGFSKISDLRRVTDANTKKLQFGGDYDTAFPIALQTQPMTVLERERWITFHNLSGRLELTREKRDWRQTFRQSLLPLSETDGRFLVGCVEKASTTTNTVA